MEPRKADENQEETQDIQILQKSITEFEQFNTGEMMAVLSDIRALNNAEIKSHPDLREQLRTRLINILNNEDKQIYDERLYKAVHDFLLVWAKYWPTDKQNWLTLSDVEGENKIVTSAGHWFDIESLIEWHNSRDYRGGEEHAPYRELHNKKYLINPKTNKPFNERDVQHIQDQAERIRKKNIDLPIITNLIDFSKNKKLDNSSFSTKKWATQGTLKGIPIGFYGAIALIIFGVTPIGFLSIASSLIVGTALGALGGAFVGIVTGKIKDKKTKPPHADRIQPAEKIIISRKMITQPESSPKNIMGLLVAEHAPNPPLEAPAPPIREREEGEPEEPRRRREDVGARAAYYAQKLRSSQPEENKREDQEIKKKSLKSRSK